MEFEYLCRITTDATIDIPDIGNVILDANNDRGDRYIFFIRTVYGLSTIIEYGPISLDGKSIGDFFSSRYDRIEYSDYHIAKRINSFLNDAKKTITQVRIVDLEDIDNTYPTIFTDLLKNS